MRFRRPMQPRSGLPEILYFARAYGGLCKSYGDRPVWVAVQCVSPRPRFPISSFVKLGSMGAHVMPELKNDHIRGDMIGWLARWSSPSVASALRQTPDQKRYAQTAERLAPDGRCRPERL